MTQKGTMSASEVLATGVKWVVCDLDGTLLTNDQVIHPRTRRAIERIRDSGISFGIASGRRPAPTSTRFGAWGLDGIVDFFVGENGGNVIDFRTDLALEGPRLSVDTVHSLIKHFEDLPVIFAVAEDNRSVLSRDNAVAREFARLDQQEFVVRDPLSYIDSPIGKISVVFDPSDVDTVLARAAEFFDPRVRIVQTHEMLVEIHSSDLTKTVGLERLAHAEGIALSEVIAFGDNDNDAEMLAEVGWGIAMSHSSEVALTSADEIIGDNDSDAIAVWLEGFFELAPPPEVLAELEDTAARVARECGRLVRDERPASVTVAETKTSATDVVTLMDKRSEKLAKELLTSLRPDDGLMGEEGLNVPSRTGITWVIDPIDGTVNYLYGIGEYAVSVAAVVGDPHKVGGWWPVAGAVYQPETDQIFVGHRGGGARQFRGDNSTMLLHTPPEELSECLVGTGFSYHQSVRIWQGELVAEILPKVRDIRRHGAAALDLCYVAAGQLDAYYESNTNPWDVAAGWVIAEEAGLVVRGLDERRPNVTMILAGSEKILAELETTIRRHVPR